MTSTGRFTPSQTAELDTAVGHLERCEALKRELDARQLAELARAMQAVWDSDPPGAGLASGAADAADAADAGKTAGLPGAARLRERGVTGRELAYRSLRLEVATALRESEHVADRLLSMAHIVTREYPSTFTQLQTGAISLNHVRVIADEGALLETGHPEVDDPRRQAYEREVLAYAREETPNRLRPIARRLAARFSEASLVSRHAAARERRFVRVTAAEDGMADLTAYLPAEDAYAIRDRIHAIARTALQAERATANNAAASASAAPAPSTPVAAVPAPGSFAVTPGRGRASTLATKGADAFRDLLLGEPEPAGTDASRVRAQIQIVVPEHGAAELIGYGIIDRETAAHLAAGADVWERVTVDDAGAVLAVDRYRPSAAMTRLLAARDLHCRAPGCRVPVTRCDTDHTIDAALGGETSTVNLAHLCRGHHVLKHHTDWSVQQDSGGIIRWTSPTGRVYQDRPPSRVRFRRATPGGDPGDPVGTADAAARTAPLTPHTAPQHTAVGTPGSAAAAAGSAAPISVAATFAPATFAPANFTASRSATGTS